jgi:Tfp pilus assembly protein PilN
MLEINLLPGGPRKKAATAGASIDFAALGASLNERFKDKVLIGSVAVMIIALGVGGYLYYRQFNDRAVAEERLTKAMEDSARFVKVVEARNLAIAKRDTLLRQVNLIRAIDDDRYIWPHIMDEVSKALPVYVWVRLLSYGGTPQGATNVVATPALPKPKPPEPGAAPTRVPAKPQQIPTDVPRDQVVLRLLGRTVDVQAMTRFMSQLEASPYLANVFNEKTTPTNDGVGDFYEFQLIINYTRPDSLSVRRLPLVASGRP